MLSTLRLQFVHAGAELHHHETARKLLTNQLCRLLQLFEPCCDLLLFRLVLRSALQCLPYILNFISSDIYASHLFSDTALKIVLRIALDCLFRDIANRQFVELHADKLFPRKQAAILGLNGIIHKITSDFLMIVYHVLTCYAIYYTNLQVILALL